MSRSIYRDLFFALSFHPSLSGAAYKVFGAYVTRHGYEGAWPSLSSLETLTGLSRKTIIKAKQELQAAGLIEVHASPKRSDLVTIPLLVEYFHQQGVENFHQAEDGEEAVEFLPASGGKSTPEVGILNNQDKRKRGKLRVVGGKNPPDKSGEIPPQRRGISGTS